MFKKTEKKPIDWEGIEAEVDTIEFQPIVKVKSVKAGKERVVLVRLSDEQKRYLNYEYKGKGAWKLSLELGARRALRTAGHVAGWTLIGTAGALVKGADPLTALIAGAATAAGGSILSLSADKAVRSAQEKNGQKSRLAVVFALIVELISLLFRKEKKNEQTQ